MDSRGANKFIWLSGVAGGLLLLLGIWAWVHFTAQIQTMPSFESSNSVIPVKVSYPAPELRLSDIDGQEISLADYRGKVVLVNMWATWCPPCREEMPDLQAYYAAHQDEGFVLLSINDGESADEVRAFADEHGLTFPLLLDTQSLSERAFRTISLPSSYVIDRDGVVRLAWKGAISRDVLESYVTPVIKE